MKNRIHGRYAMHAGNYDWGCSIDYAILTLDEEMSAIDAALLSVTEKKQVTDMKSENFSLYVDTFPRDVKAAFLCDACGNAVEGASKYVKVELEVAPEVGSPFAFTSKAQVFLWTDPYELLFTYEGDVELEIEHAAVGKVTAADAFSKKEYVTTDGTVYPYAEYLSKRPTDTLFVWLHGMGEGQIEGSDAYLPLLGHKGTVLAGEAFQKAVGAAHVLVPQCPTYWMDADGKRGNLLEVPAEDTGILAADGTSYYTDSLNEMIDAYAKKVGAKRIALGGCSNGGYMVLMMAIKNPGKYCALVPVCEAVPDRTISDEKIENLAKESLYFIYAEDDPIVLPELHEIPTIERLKKAGAKDLHVFHPDHVVDTSGLYKNEDGTPYQYMGHLSWIYFDNNETDDGEGLSVWEWLGDRIKRS